ncbi:TauD/TfdA family dioxygenase [Actinosynnema mirum]|uniref:Taurine catabolism dioxygenase TauD/TfdA n=1 Tax=Actinosynnema mirum (strain ATCC 29888 / DSM 43827 / JCM 3225 / NBRC 14064 / NCIMB 13271 / NRRL B-12336 / IMRU 3971 / 101) TaxID=446462 RepID=C6WBZ0_ACTMD|nr:TauD/TfdA family dioxygenase [Actinosynnema mirum]ACU37557.1 Taurine catabolism dioxygenase TauD/TfdA [Actinosynnema mirum DSM 43827]
MSADPGDWARPIGPPEGATLPLRVVATEPGVDLARWAGDQADRVRSWLDLHGAVLLRGFGVDLDGFPAVVQAFVGAPSPYVQRSSPRTEIGNRIYTATDHPADQTILMHSENSYQRDFPGRLVFCCLRPPATGGATPVADTRRVLARIAPDLVARFAEHGVRYVRNYGTGLGMSWQEAFQTGKRAHVEQYCREQDVDFEWTGPDRLRTSQVRPALAAHPRTGEPVWFNHSVFFHPGSLPEQVRAQVGRRLTDDDLPATTCFGDGSPIPEDALRRLRAAYEAERVSVPWEPGDVLVVDNLLAAHGREPYTGERRVVVGMGDPLTWDAVRWNAPVPP